MHGLFLNISNSVFAEATKKKVIRQVIVYVYSISLLRKKIYNACLILEAHRNLLTLFISIKFPFIPPLSITSNILFKKIRI